MNTDLNRIFVVGCPRSGTTLIQSFIAAHPLVASFPETHFFYRIRLRKKYGLTLADPTAARREAARFLDEVDRRDLLDQMPLARGRRAMARPVVAGFSTILDQLARDAGKLTWVEKTPMHLHVYDYISKLLPHPARFVHIVRDGRDVAASLYEAAKMRPEVWGNKSPTDFAERWIKDVKITEDAIGHPEHTVILYEDLVRDPERTLRRLCAFAGLSYDPSMVTHRAEAA